jgi:hypothetical protein
VVAVKLLIVVERLRNPPEACMGNCSSANGVEKAPTSVNEGSRRTVPTVPKAQERKFSRRSFMSSSPNILVFQNEEIGLEQCLEASAACCPSREQAG